MQVVADRYEVCVTSASLPRARQIVGPGGAPAAVPDAPVTPVASPEEPPRYGERIPPQAPADAIAHREPLEPPA
jgi:hypothetical protein